MPIREFKCVQGHVTEKILTGVEDEVVKEIICMAGGITSDCGPTCKPDDLDHHCFRTARRQDVPSRCSFRLMPGGSGGFHSPSSI